MAGWIIVAALGSVAVTALLTFVLWRLNAPSREPSAARNDGSEGVAFVAPIVIAGETDGRDTFDGTSNAGSDGGGSDGGGGGGK